SAGVRLHNPDVRCVDGATGIHIGPEITGPDQPTELRLSGRNIARIDATTGVYVTDEDTHRHRHIAEVNPIAHTAQRDRDVLGIGDSGQIHDDGVCPIAARGYNRANTRSYHCAGNGHWRSERDHDSIIAG